MFLPVGLALANGLGIVDNVGKQFRGVLFLLDFLDVVTHFGSLQRLRGEVRTATFGLT